MSDNRADTKASRPFVIGPCTCPGRPHTEDTADLRVLYGYGELGRIRQAGRLAGIEAYMQAAILIGVVRWNLVLANGSARPIDADEVGLLSESIVDRLMADDGLGAAFGDDELPNPSAAPSPSGSQESGFPTPTTPEPATSTST